MNRSFTQFQSKKFAEFHQQGGDVNDDGEINGKDPENKTFLNCKLKMCKILIWLLNIGNEIRCNSFLYDMKKYSEQNPEKFSPPATDSNFVTERRHPDQILDEEGSSNIKPQTDSPQDSFKTPRDNQNDVSIISHTIRGPNQNDVSIMSQANKKGENLNDISIISNMGHNTEKKNSSGEKKCNHASHARKRASMKRPVNSVYEIMNKSLNDNFSIDIDKDDEFVTLLLRLTLSKNVEVKSEALTLLHKVYARTSELGDTLLDLIIIDSQEVQTSYLFTVELADGFRVLGETSEKWYDDIECNDFKKYKSLVRSLENLFFSNKSKHQSDPSLSEVSQKFGRSEETPEDEILSQKNNLFMLLDADGTTPKNRNKNNKIKLSTINKYRIKVRIYGIDAFYQSLFKHLKISDSFVQICSENLQLGEENETEVHQYYLQKLYLLLALACNQNSSNKIIFADFIKSIVIPQMAKDPYNEGLYLCLGEIITDNNF